MPFTGQGNVEGPGGQLDKADGGSREDVCTEPDACHPHFCAPRFFLESGTIGQFQ